MKRRKKKEKENFPSISQCFVFAIVKETISNHVVIHQQKFLIKFCNLSRDDETYFEAVKILLSTHAISLIEASVFISAKASQVFTFHSLMSPPRQPDSKMSE